MYPNYDQGINQRHQVVLVECDIDEADRWIQDPRNCSHFLDGQARRPSCKSGSSSSIMNRHALEMLRILKCIPPQHSFACDQHIGFFEVSKRSSIAQTKATQTKDLRKKESSRNVRVQHKSDGQKKYATSNVSCGVMLNQPAPPMQCSRGPSTWKTSKKMPSMCQNFITVVTQSTNSTTRRSSHNGGTLINNTVTHTLPIRSILKERSETDLSLPSRQRKGKMGHTIDYTYYLNRCYSEVTNVYKEHYSKIEYCTPIVQWNCCSLNRVKFIVNYVEGELSIPMYKLTSVTSRIGVAHFRPVVGDVKSPKLFRSVKYDPPITKIPPSSSVVHRPPNIHNFSLVYIENVDGYFVKKERPSFKDGSDKSASLGQTPITPRIPRHNSRYYMSPTPVGESLPHSQPIWTSAVRNLAPPMSRKFEVTSSEVQTTPELLDTLTVGSRIREDKSKRHTSSIFSLIQRRLHKRGPKRGRHK
ncbi:unnamed protein product [Hydatigera taeniaeformis]|uniref:DUF3715 domain-containing protein n=1 Tax=Hydatigena taeniaeformis TaxID=6205 RepID=A0A0R3X8A6_HYDTA|nr:unnamed protein product [Hydatigera taeniaeformis]